MKHHWSLLLVFFSSVAGMSPAQAAVQTKPDAHPSPQSIGHPVEHQLKLIGSTSIDLRSLPRTKPTPVEREELEAPEVEPIALPGAPQPNAPTPLVTTAPAPAPLMNFDGLDAFTWSSGDPPDTNGDVGPTYFIQTANIAIGIFNKSTGAQVAAFSFNTLMSQGNFGTTCDTNNAGDPVVIYDTFEDRWIITDFAFTGIGNFQCFAVSKTGDPVAGGWNFYSITISDAFSDYPKFGIWPDGLYMMGNLFFQSNAGSYLHPRAFALNKAQMYAGAPEVQVVAFDLPKLDFTPLPANARLQTGTPPAGSPNYYSVVYQYNNAISIYKFHVAWDRISTSTLTGPFISMAPASWATAPSSVALVGGSTVDSLPTRTMAQNQYTRNGSVESVWSSHSVLGAAAGLVAPRFYQVDVSGGTVSATTTQAFTHAPDATISRWLPSVAIDRVGDMAIGYSAASTSLYPSIRYAGRFSSDPVNTLSFTETSLIDGADEPVFPSPTRWGDYSSLALDPSDGCTFWISNEYYGSAGWRTRIGSFRLNPGTCFPFTTSLSGTVKAAADGTPIVGANVLLGSTRALTTDASGAFNFPNNLLQGAYPSLTASAPGFDTVTVANVVASVSAPEVNFLLTAAPRIGCFTDTTQSDFQTATLTQIDLDSSPGNALLSQTSIVDQFVNFDLDKPPPNDFSLGSFVSATFAQTFTPAVTGNITRVDLALGQQAGGGTSPNLVVSIRATTGSPAVPTGPDLASATIPGVPDGAKAYYGAVFASPLLLTAGSTYAIIMKPVSNGGLSFGVETSATDVYAGGRLLGSIDNGATWILPAGGAAIDAGFKAYVIPISGDLISALKDSNPASTLVPDWTTFSWTATTPANTTLRFQVAGSNSPYGPFNYVGPNGSAFSYYTTSGGTLDPVYGKRYMRYRAYLASADGSATPTVSDVTVCHANYAVADLAITVDDGVTTANPGGLVVYTITVTNANPVARPATGPLVSDNFPAGLTCSWTCSGTAGTTCKASGSGNILDDTLVLPSASSVAYTATCAIADTASGSISNTANVSYIAEPNMVNNSATDTDTLVRKGDLSISNSDGVISVLPGGSLTYTIVASNAGPSKSTNATVVDNFPAALTCSWTCAGSNGGTCTTPGTGNINKTVTLPKSGSVTYTANCSVSAAATGSIVNTATITAPVATPDPDTSNNSATDTDAVAVLADLSISNSNGVSSLVAGGNTTYAIVVTNPSANAVSNVGVTDTFPAGLTACSWTCSASSGGSCQSASGNGSIATTTNTIAASGTLSFSAVCGIAGNASGSIANTASVAYANDPVSTNNNATDSDPVTVQADVALTISDGLSYVRIGDTLAYAINVTNPSGPSTAVAMVTDTLPAQLKNGSWTCAGTGSATCGNGTGNALSDTATIPMGGKAAYVYSATVQSAGANEHIVNTASASLTSGTDGTPANNTQTDTDIVVIFESGFENPPGG